MLSLPPSPGGARFPRSDPSRCGKLIQADAEKEKKGGGIAPAPDPPPQNSQGVGSENMSEGSGSMILVLILVCAHERCRNGAGLGLERGLPGGGKKRGKGKKMKGVLLYRRRDMGWDSESLRRKKKRVVYPIVPPPFFWEVKLEERGGKKAGALINGDCTAMIDGLFYDSFRKLEKK